MKKVLVTLLVLAILSSITYIIIRSVLSEGGGGDWIGFDSLEDMAEFSTDVVRAEILSSRVEEVEFEGYAFSDIYTFYTIQILEVFQGDLEVGNEVEMSQWGDGLGREGNWISIGVGDDLILFLVNHDSSAPAGFPLQGVYRLSRQVSNSEELDPTIELIPVLSRNIGLYGSDIIVTVEDLWGLRSD